MKTYIAIIVLFIIALSYLSQVSDRAITADTQININNKVAN